MERNRVFAWMLSGSVVLAAQLTAGAHNVSPAEIEICGVDSAAVAEFTVADAGDCSALISAISGNTSVVTVTPQIISAVSHTFQVEAFSVGTTQIVVTWIGDEDDCTEQGSFTIPVTVRDATHPKCRGDGELTFEFRALDVAPSGQFITSLNQRGANVFITHDPSGSDCSKVIITQTIKLGDGDWMVDVDPEVTGVDTPFYNYDPASGMGVSSTGLGQVGDSASGTNAELHDVPLQTSQAVQFETCAICCDDGRTLDCWSWSYDPTADRGTSIDGVRQAGLYIDNGRIDDFSADSRAAYRDRIAEYKMDHPDAAGDPCLSNFEMALGGGSESTSDDTPSDITVMPTGGSMGCVVSGRSARFDVSWLTPGMLLFMRRRPRVRRRTRVQS